MGWFDRLRKRFAGADGDAPAAEEAAPLPSEDEPAEAEASEEVQSAEETVEEPEEPEIVIEYPLFDDLQTYTIWFSNCQCTREEGRKNLTLRWSRDDGKTWHGDLLVAEEGGYSDITCSPDGEWVYMIAETEREVEGTPWSFNLNVYAIETKQVLEK